MYYQITSIRIVSLFVAVQFLSCPSNVAFRMSGAEPLAVIEMVTGGEGSAHDSSDQGSDHPSEILDIEKDAGQEEAAAGLHRVVTAQDWTGPDDPENPWNWARGKRIAHTAVMALMGFAATFATSAFVPGIDGLMADMGISHELALAGLSLWTLGLAVGPVLGAPLSERFGRLRVLQLSMLVSMLFVVGGAVSSRPAALMVCRFFGGCFSGPILAVGGGMIADIWPPHRRTIGVVFFTYAPFAGPALGPVISGFAAQQRGWRFTQWVTLLVEGVSLLLALAMSESHKTTLLKRRSRKLSIAPPKPTMPEGTAAVKMALVLTIARPLHMLVTEPIVGLFSLYVAFNFSLLYAYFDAYPIVFETVYGFDIEQVGLAWLGVLLGCTLGIMIFISMDHWTYYRPLMAARARDGKATVAPERRLYPAMVGGLGLTTGLFWLAWTARSDVHWISPVLSAVPLAAGNFLVFVSPLLNLLRALDRRTADDMYGVER